MCTVSILPVAGGGYDLWFNRDEKFARAPESGPESGSSSDGARWVAPRDGERGGAWLLLNEHGLTLCVLNDYENEGAAAGELSRGRLPFAGAGRARAADAVADVRAMAEAVGAERFGAFFFLAVEESGATRRLHWSGRGWSESEGVDFATSSSWRPGETRRAREALHARLAATEGRTREGLEALHRAHDTAAPAESIRMRRDDACTRSICRVRVRAGGSRELVYEAVDWSRADGAGRRVEARP